MRSAAYLSTSRQDRQDVHSALAEITEGGVDTWGVLYLRNHLATGVLLGAGAYVVGQAVAAATLPAPRGRTNWLE